MQLKTTSAGAHAPAIYSRGDGYYDAQRAKKGTGNGPSVVRLIQGSAVVSAFKVDLRWQDGARLTDRTETNDVALALAAFRALLARDDLTGQDVAVRFVVGGRSLYYSNFRKPLGQGRIHPDAPLDPDASRDQADQLARWLPPVAARPGAGSGAGGERAASGDTMPAGTPEAVFPLTPGAAAQLVEWLAVIAQEEPTTFRRVLDQATRESAAKIRAGEPDSEEWMDGERARSILVKAARKVGL